MPRFANLYPDSIHKILPQAWEEQADVCGQISHMEPHTIPGELKVSRAGEKKRTAVLNHFPVILYYHVAVFDVTVWRNVQAFSSPTDWEHPMELVLIILLQGNATAYSNPPSKKDKGNLCFQSLISFCLILFLFIYFSQTHTGMWSCDPAVTDDHCIWNIDFSPPFLKDRKEHSKSHKKWKIISIAQWRKQKLLKTFNIISNDLSSTKEKKRFSFLCFFPKVKFS